MTNIALIGYGKMGRALDRLAAEANTTIAVRIDPRDPQADSNELTAQALESADVCIDFSHPDAVMDNIKKITDIGKPMVIGTTGWYDEISTVRDMVLAADTGALYAENFSIGVNVFLKIVAEAARLMNDWPQYDVSCIESHHRMKADMPSGTAQAIAKEIVAGLDRKHTLYDSSCEQPVRPEELQIASVRCGAIPGTHSVILDSEVDSITLTHQAHNRDAFALGALQAARWLVGRKGFHHLSDMIETDNGDMQ